MDRIGWEGLLSELRETVHGCVGTLVETESITQGRRSALALVGRTRTGRVFFKGAPLEDERAVAQLDREAAVAPHVAAIAPALVCDVTAAGWRLLEFEHVEGRRANYSPDSPDLDAVLDVLAALDVLTVPDDVGLMWFEGRWSDYAVAPQRLSRLAGIALLHTDLNRGTSSRGKTAQRWSTGAWRRGARRS
ncbi:hypothetical protein [Actinomadura sp. BRA 177]|uniref:hypothetical protein n=1 Tax=Actinomadura sp. BRA 177 TaxID=2745202 RepID=UPI0015950472|nr:hypothetical protein [Actinomadura sp. BRA 177]